MWTDLYHLLGDEGNIIATPSHLDNTGFVFVVFIQMLWFLYQKVPGYLILTRLAKTKIIVSERRLKTG